MKSKSIIQAIVFGSLALIVIAFLLSCISGEKYDKTLDGRQIAVSWEYVNIRERPNTSSKILGTLKYGQKVTLNGKTFESADGPNSSWVQLECGGWVVTPAFAGNWR